MLFSKEIHRGASNGLDGDNSIYYLNTEACGIGQRSFLGRLYYPPHFQHKQQTSNRMVVKKQTYFLISDKQQYHDENVIIKQT